MKVIHRFALRLNASQSAAIISLGIRIPKGIALPGGGDPFVAFDLGEEHPQWIAAQALMSEWRASDVVRSEFSREEVDSAEWVALVGNWQHGYPQPNELDFGYRRATYDLSDWCDRCGTGLHQIRDFQMKGEPKWGRNGILQLNWVFDEYFVTPSTWSAAFSAHGVSTRPVLDVRGAPLKTAVQLVIDEEIEVDATHLPSETCERCKRVKYKPVVRSRFPAPRSSPKRSIARTCEYFGAGAQAYRGILASHALARALLSAGIKGVSLVPT